MPWMNDKYGNKIWKPEVAKVEGTEVTKPQQGAESGAQQFQMTEGGVQRTGKPIQTASSVFKKQGLVGRGRREEATGTELNRVAALRQFATEGRQQTRELGKVGTEKLELSDEATQVVLPSKLAGETITITSPQGEPIEVSYNSLLTDYMKDETKEDSLLNQYIEHFKGTERKDIVNDLRQIKDSVDVQLKDLEAKKLEDLPMNQLGDIEGLTGVRRLAALRQQARMGRTGETGARELAEEEAEKFGIAKQAAGERLGQRVEDVELEAAQEMKRQGLEEYASEIREELGLDVEQSEIMEALKEIEFEDYGQEEKAGIQERLSEGEIATEAIKGFQEDIKNLSTTKWLDTKYTAENPESIMASEELGTIQTELDSVISNLQEEDADGKMLLDEQTKAELENDAKEWVAVQNDIDAIGQTITEELPKIKEIEGNATTYVKENIDSVLASQYTEGQSNLDEWRAEWLAHLRLTKQQEGLRSPTKESWFAEQDLNMKNTLDRVITDAPYREKIIELNNFPPHVVKTLRSMINMQTATYKEELQQSIYKDKIQKGLEFLAPSAHNLLMEGEVDLGGIQYTGTPYDFSSLFKDKFEDSQKEVGKKQEDLRTKYGNQTPKETMKELIALSRDIEGKRSKISSRRTALKGLAAGRTEFQQGEFERGEGHYDPDRF